MRNVNINAPSSIIGLRISEVILNIFQRVEEAVEN